MKYAGKTLLYAVCLLLAVSVARAEEVVENFPDGSPKAKYFTNKDGQKDGKYYEYFPGGKVKVEAFYRDDKLHGRYREKNEDGKYILKAEYKEGELDGDYVKYEDDGRTKTFSAEYSEGQYDGEVVTYEDGKEAEVQLYDEGFLTHPRSKKSIEADLKWIADHDPRKDETKKEPEATVTPPAGGEGGNAETYSAPRLAALRRLMGYRCIVGMPYRHLTLHPDLNAYAAWGAKINAHYNKLDHHPKNPGWPEEDYQKAYTGCSKANLSMGSAFDKSVDGYMFDSDPSNIDRVGHRRWCINPRMGTSGFGAWKGGKGIFGSMMAHDTSNGDVPAWEALCFPCRGYMPIEYFGFHNWGKGEGYAWSVTLNPSVWERADKGSTKVKVYDLNAKKKKKKSRKKKDEGEDAPGELLELDYFNVEQSGFGVPNCVIFRPKGLQVRDGNKYMVEITGIKKKDGSADRFEYLVEFANIK